MPRLRHLFSEAEKRRIDPSHPYGARVAKSLDLNTGRCYHIYTAIKGQTAQVHCAGKKDRKEADVYAEV